jgi:hypothetical protein
MATSQFKIRFPVLAMIYVPALMFMLAVAALASLHDGISVGVLLSDPASTLGTHPLLGVQSNLGVLVWCAAAAICLFSSAILRFTRTDKEVRSFLLWAGVITSVLLLDDFFLFHDDLALRYLPFDGDANYVDEFIIASYGLALALYLVRFRERILGSEYLLLLILAFLFLGLSAILDFFTAPVIDSFVHRFFYEEWDRSWTLFFEDGFKFLGIVSWGGYWVRTCLCAIAPDQEKRQGKLRT